MANKPTIYGFDDAGCKWETAHKEDVEAMENNLKNGRRFMIPGINSEYTENENILILTVTPPTQDLLALKSKDLFILPVDSTVGLSSKNLDAVKLQLNFKPANGMVFGMISIKHSGGVEILNVHKLNPTSSLLTYNLDNRLTGVTTIECGLVYIGVKT